MTAIILGALIGLGIWLILAIRQANRDWNDPHQ